jgi:hypothetical protein
MGEVIYLPVARVDHAEPPIDPKTCLHPYKSGAGSSGSDGSGSISWSCHECGASEGREWGASVIPPTEQGAK